MPTIDASCLYSVVHLRAAIPALLLIGTHDIACLQRLFASCSRVRIELPVPSLRFLSLLSQPQTTMSGDICFVAKLALFRYRPETAGAGGRF